MEDVKTKELTIVYVDAGNRHVVALPKKSTFITALDYFISLFDRSCSVKKTHKGVQVEYKCPHFDVCDRKKCLVTEELRQLQQKVDR